MMEYFVTLYCLFDEQVFISDCLPTSPLSSPPYTFIIRFVNFLREQMMRRRLAALRAMALAQGPTDLYALRYDHISNPSPLLIHLQDVVTQASHNVS